MVPLFLSLFWGFLSALVLWVFPKISLMDRPERYGYKRVAVPYPAGAVLL